MIKFGSILALNIFVFSLLRYATIVIAFILGLASSEEFVSTYGKFIYLPALLLHCGTLFFIYSTKTPNARTKINNILDSSDGHAGIQMNQYLIIIVILILLFLGSFIKIIPDNLLIPN